MLPFENIIHVDRNSNIAIYKQIAISIINAINNGTLKAGAKLPSSRELSKLLSLHRKTIVAAYEELSAQDWIQSSPRKSITVSNQIPMLYPKIDAKQNKVLAYENKLSLPFKILKKEVKNSENDNSKITINDGYPDVRLSPLDELLKTYRSYLARNYAIENAHIGNDQGTISLREELAEFLAESRGLNIKPDNILVTHGAQMSIYLASKLLLNDGDIVVVGNPNYSNANETFVEVGAKLLEVNVDANGLDVDKIEQICKKKKITAVYVIPHHHYPTTVTLSVERRMKLLALSQQYSFVIIEDDYDYDYHYNSSPYLPLANANHSGNVIYIGSFSKILDPSLRIGFMVAPANFIAQTVALRKLIDVGGDGYMQNALASLIKNGELKRHLKRALKAYHFRRDFLNELLEKKLGKYVQYNIPSGGMAFWIELKAPYKIKDLVKDSQLKIKRWDEALNAFRFGFASMNEQELTITVTYLAKLFKKMDDQQSGLSE
ncbi:MocR-like pyridoxine biosynthesis transcription factor PdxR [Empedobacter falsenii]